MMRHSLSGVSLLALAVSLSPTSVLAEDTATASTLEPIIITATKRSEDYFLLPSTADIANADALLSRGIDTVADLDRIRNVANRVKREVDAGNQVAVVVSAMSGVTNQLVKWCQDLSPLHDAREYDTVVATGEQVTTGLTAMALQAIGVDARSWQGWQVPIITDQAHGKARVEKIDGALLIERMEAGQVPVIAGFQGVENTRHRITTLGRGGSDLSAVAIAAAVKADRCDIYTDVDGIYTTDPRIVPRARKLERISFEEMLELASVGAKVLQTR
ncbi:MAG: aspartate kinase, partial [Proteobacteria bacterium]|nr:aspartate kinase [Pseudomonadota bacterium]